MSLDLERLLLKEVNALIGKITGNHAGHTYLLNAIVEYVNLRDRVPSIRSWVVFKSDFLHNQVLDANTSEGLQKFVSAAEAGEDLRPWLHESIFNGEQDALMNDWGVQHYHLGLQFSSKTGRKRICRTKSLLFAIHKEDSGNLYLIGIFDHGSFSNEQLLKIVNAQWPELLGHAKINNLTETDHLQSSKEIHDHRKNKINAAVKIDDDFFMGPGGGYTISGHSTRAVMEAMGAINKLRWLQNEVNSKQLSVRFVVKDRSVFLVDETQDRCYQVL